MGGEPLDANTGRPRGDAGAEHRRSRRRGRRRPRGQAQPDTGRPWEVSERPEAPGFSPASETAEAELPSDAEAGEAGVVDPGLLGPVAEPGILEDADRLVHVAFRGGRVEAFVNPRNDELRDGDRVIVEAERGVDYGRIVACQGPDLKRRKSQPLRAVVRHATEDEAERLVTISTEDREALGICRSRAAHFRLEMKVVDAETQFDGNRVTFYFTADHRVDFRELVRDLASIFRTRIELRQVGARDAARRCDGMGLCGRPLCCNTFLREFEPVTLKMAKEQCLALNPAKISGACGRLMCCLTYECAAYQQASRQAPVLGSCWILSGQTVTVRLRDVGNNRVFVEDESEQLMAVDLGVFTTGQATPVRIEVAPEEAHEEVPENGDPEPADGNAAADPPGPR